MALMLATVLSQNPKAKHRKFANFYASILEFLQICEARDHCEFLRNRHRLPTGLVVADATEN